MIIEDIAKAIFDKLKEHPCKSDKCLVRTTCEKTLSNCDVYVKYAKQRRKVESMSSDIEGYILLFLIIVGTCVTIATFCLGIWKWVEIFKAAF